MPPDKLPLVPGLELGDAPVARALMGLSQPTDYGQAPGPVAPGVDLAAPAAAPVVASPTAFEVPGQPRNDNFAPTGYRDAGQHERTVLERAERAIRGGVDVSPPAGVQRDQLPPAVSVLAHERGEVHAPGGVDLAGLSAIPGVAPVTLQPVAAPAAPNPAGAGAYPGGKPAVGGFVVGPVGGEPVGG
jgi:hypothetical protein